MTIYEVIEKLKQWHQPFTKQDTRDTIKFGIANQECTGIAVTVCATAEVIRKAAELGANLIISHESIFFGDEFSLADFGENETIEKKQDMMLEHGIVVWRDHDHMHGMGKPFAPERVRPDYIFYGIMKELGWEKYVIGDTLKPTWYQIPETTVEELAQFFMEKFNVSGMRLVGSREGKVSTVFFCEHVSGRFDLQKMKDAVNADVMVPLEINDWTLTEYVRDTTTLGKPKTIMEMGHFNVEELGMKYMLQWLPEAIGEEIPLHFVQAGDTYQYVLRK